MNPNMSSFLKHPPRHKPEKKEEIDHTTEC